MSRIGFLLAFVERLLKSVVLARSAMGESRSITTRPANSMAMGTKNLRFRSNDKLLVVVGAFEVDEDDPMENHTCFGAR